MANLATTQAERILGDAVLGFSSETQIMKTHGHSAKGRQGISRKSKEIASERSAPDSLISTACIGNTFETVPRPSGKGATVGERGSSRVIQFLCTFSLLSFKEMNCQVSICTSKPKLNSRTLLKQDLVTGRHSHLPLKTGKGNLTHRSLISPNCCYSLDR